MSSSRRLPGRPMRRNRRRRTRGLMAREDGYALETAARGDDDRHGCRSKVCAPRGSGRVSRLRVLPLSTPSAPPRPPRRRPLLGRTKQLSEVRTLGPLCRTRNQRNPQSSRESSLPQSLGVMISVFIPLEMNRTSNACDSDPRCHGEQVAQGVFRFRLQTCLGICCRQHPMRSWSFPALFESSSRPLNRVVVPPRNIVRSRGRHVEVY